VENLPAKPVEIRAGELGINAHVREVELLVGLAGGRLLLRKVLPGRIGESGQSAYGQ
jgi:hypothetical protein